MVHYAITGRTPPESVARLVNDTMVPLATLAAGRYSERFLRAIDHALAVRPEQRPQSAIALRDELGVEERRSRARKADRIPTAPSPLDSTVVVRDGPPMAPRESESPMNPSARQSAPPKSTARGSGAASVPPEERLLPGRRAGRAWLFVAVGALVTVLSLAWWSLPPRRWSPRVDAQPPTAAPTITPRHDASVTAPLPPAAPAPTTIAAPPADRPQPAAGACSRRGGTAAPPSRRPRHASGRWRPPHPGVRPLRKNSPNPRCTEIITRASLGEELSAQDQAMLKGECRK